MNVLNIIKSGSYSIGNGADNIKSECMAAIEFGNFTGSLTFFATVAGDPISSRSIYYTNLSNGVISTSAITGSGIFSIVSSATTLLLSASTAGTQTASVYYNHVTY